MSHPTLLETELPDHSVDLFFTDPPYTRESLGAYSELARLAQAKLKPGGLCLAYSPHPHLPEVIRLMGEHLDYWWAFAVFQTGPQPRIWERGIWVGWKPVLAFGKRPLGRRLTDTWLCDSIRGGGSDKRYHEWGQEVREAAYFIEALCPPGGLVVDPFCGGGTTLVAAKVTGRRWLGTEIDPAYAAEARKRLEETPAGCSASPDRDGGVGRPAGSEENQHSVPLGGAPGQAGGGARGPLRRTGQWAGG